MDKISTQKSSSFHWIQIVRVLVGVLFIFSGLIKANDPYGLSFKMQEFFGLWNMAFLNDYAFAFSITVITFEILAGFCILIGFAYNIMAFLVLLLMIFFTFLTAYAVWYEKSTGLKLACGCFGDCIPLKAIESFWKDIILLVLVTLLLIYRNKIRPIFNKKVAIIVLGVITIITLALQWRTVKFLPFVDCLPYKVGNNLPEQMRVPEDAEPDVFETTHIYKNMKTGESTKFNEDEYLAQKIWEDTLTWQHDTSYSILIKEGNMIPKIVGFDMKYFDGEEATEFILTQEKPVFLWFVKDVNTASLENLDHIKQLIKLCDAQEMYFYMVTSNNQAETDAFLLSHQMEVYTVALDPTTLKTAMRTNPGLMLLDKGTVIGKWSYKDYPSAFTIGQDGKLNLNK